MKLKRIAFLSLFLLAIAVHRASAQDTQSRSLKNWIPSRRQAPDRPRRRRWRNSFRKRRDDPGPGIGLVNSASLMVPCPWFPEIADYAKSHPDADLGLHLTLTSERVYYRWGPVARKTKSRVSWMKTAYFHHDWKPTTRINPKEVDLELRAQIDRAYAMGLRPTHLDSHQYRLFDNGQDLFEVVVRIAHDYRLPVFVARDWFAERPYLEKSLGPADIVIDHTITIDPGVAPDNWADSLQDRPQKFAIWRNRIRHPPRLRRR